MVIETKSSRKRIKGKKIILSLAAILWLAGTGFLVYSFLENRKENNDLRSQLNTANQALGAYKTNPQEAAKAEVQRYVDEVGKLYALPQDEEPSVATVSDITKLKDQPFFAKAQNGDVTLIYTNAKLAVLYRPGSKQIINVSAVTIDQNAQPAPATPPATP